MLSSDFSKKPNFFIIGAPKCGTTSLAKWLGEHHNIFMSNPKEPHFFNTDSQHRSYTDLTEYESLFQTAHTEQHIARGEASVWYLISKNAVDNIFNYQPDAKVIVCLRNPIEACVSLHDQKYFSGDETVKDFKTAWSIQDRRKNNPKIVPPNCVDVRELLYGDSCRFGLMVSKLVKTVPQNQLQVVLFDDLKKNPVDVYRSALKFLSVDDDDRTDFPIANPSKRRHFVFLTRFQRRVHRLKHRLGIRSGIGLGKLMNNVNRAERKRSPLDDETLRELHAYFKDDIELLENTLNRNLSHWKTVSD